jgi:voltage-gated sodium channel
MRKLFLNDKFILLLIAVNTVCIFIEGFQNVPPQAQRVASIIDYAITILFILELMVKVQLHGIRGYLSTNWNRLDLLLVVLSLSSLFLPLTSHGDRDFSYLLVLRISRVFKFFRFLRFVPGIEHLIAGVQRALKASIVVIIGFFVFIVVCALVSNNLFKEMAPDYFGDPVQSMYAIFRIFTIEGWYEIPDAVIKNQPALAVFFIRIYFIFLLITGGLFGLSIVNSIFVDAMVADNNDNLERKVDILTEELRSLRESLEKPPTKKWPRKRG